MSDITEVLTADRADAAAPGQWRPVMRSPVNAIHQHHGARLSVSDGWEIPRSYRDIERERAAIRDGLGLADITARGKIDLRGAVDVALASLPQTHGAALARVSRSWALVLTPPPGLNAVLELMRRTAGSNTMVTDATSIYTSIALLGPRVDDLLQRLVAIDPSTLRPGDCLATQMLRVPAILLRRELPLSIVETYIPAEFARYAWDAIFEVARPLAPEAVGWDALQAEGWH